jgi:hypothetical protein
MANKTSKPKKQTAAHVLEIKPEPGESEGTSFARVALDPVVRHASIASSYASRIFSEVEPPSIMESTEALQNTVAKAEEGDLRIASRLLASQAVSLDAMFTELARRSGANMGEYTDAAERYMRLALRAQSNCRTTVEALAKLHQPREQTVRHVHVNDGGNAIVTDHFHNHTGGKENVEKVEQPHATGTVGGSTPLLGQDAQGNGVPITSREGAKAVQNARRQ